MSPDTQPTSSTLDPEMITALMAATGELDSAMQPTPVKIVCWAVADRAMFPPDGDPVQHVGSRYVYPGFLLLTTDRSKVVPLDGQYMMAVVVPQGTQGLWFSEARELRLARQTTFRVVSVNGTVVKVAVVPSDAEPPPPVSEVPDALEQELGQRAAAITSGLINAIAHSISGQP